VLIRSESPAALTDVTLGSPQDDSSEMDSDDERLDLSSCAFQDDEYSSDEESNVPSWRLAPEKSFSDFVIAVTVEIDVDNTSTAPTEYHVHKERLTVGPRKSIVFAKAIHTKMTEAAEGKYSTTLQKSAADAFPIMLDYIYTGDEKKFAEPNGYVHYVALRFLSNYFGVGRLHKRVNWFIECSNFPLRHVESFSALAHTWEESISYNDEKMMNALRKKTLHSVKDEWNKEMHRYSLECFLSLLPSDLIRCVWESPQFLKFSRLDRSEARIETLAEVLYDQRENVDDEIVLLVMRRSILLKNLTFKAAMKLLELICRESESFKMQLKELENHCVDVVAESWQEGFQMNRRYEYSADDRPSKRQRVIETSCENFTDDVKSKLLPRIVARASEDLRAERDEKFKFLENYMNLGQSMQHSKFAFESPDKSLFIFGATGASGAYRLYSDSMQGLGREYTMQNQYQYDDYGHTDDGGQFTLVHNKLTSKWQITVRYKTGDSGNQYLNKLLYECKADKNSTGVPKAGWKNSSGVVQPNIFVQHFEAMRQAKEQVNLKERKSAPSRTSI
jgi:hypothetical protein